MRSPLAKPDLALTGLNPSTEECNPDRMLGTWSADRLSQSDGLIYREICRKTPWDHYGSKRRKLNLSPKLQASHIPGNQGDLDSFKTLMMYIVFVITILKRMSLKARNVCRYVCKYSKLSYFIFFDLYLHVHAGRMQKMHGVAVCVPSCYLFGMRHVRHI